LKVQKKAPSDSPTRARALRSLRNPAYRFYLTGSLFQFASLSAQIVVGPLLIYRLTGSTALLGLMALLSSVPMMVLSLYGGAIADRFSKKKIIVISMFSGAIISLLLAAALTTGIVSPDIYGSWWIVIGMMTLMGCLMGIMMPALQSLVADIVEREELMNAVALNTFGMSILNLVAPGIAGVMIDTFDFHSVYFAMAVLYLGGMSFIYLIPIQKQPQSEKPSRSNIWTEIVGGFQYIRKNVLIYTILVFVLLSTVLSMPYQQLLPVFVDDILGVGATGMGILMSVSGAGALAGSAVIALMPNRKRGLLLIISGLVTGVALIAFSASSIWALSLGTMVFIGLGQTFRMTIGSTLLQTNADPRFRGRVMSIFSMQWGLMGLCTFVAGIIAETQPVQWVLGSLAGMLVIITLLYLVSFGYLRSLE